jgi:hypothetical protein
MMEKTAQPEKTNCWDTFTFNDSTCTWDNDGKLNLLSQQKWTVGILYFQQFYLYLDNDGTAQPAAPEKSKLLGYFYFQQLYLYLDNDGTQPAAPEKVNCWDTYFQHSTCN